jgi:hypothetical protein
MFYGNRFWDAYCTSAAVCTVRLFQLTKINLSVDQYDALRIYDAEEIN